MKQPSRAPSAHTSPRIVPWALVALLLALAPLGAQQKLAVVNIPLAQDLVKIFPELSSGYIDLSGNGKPDQGSDLNEYVPESRVRDGQLQAQEILDFIVENWRFIPLEKLQAVQKAVKGASGAIGELIAIDYSQSLDDAVSQRQAMGEGLYLTPSAYKDAMAKMGDILSSMASAYKKEGGKSDSDFTSARDSLFQMIDKGYPLPPDLPADEAGVLSTSMTSVVLKEQSSNPARVRTAIRTLGLLKAQEAGPVLSDLAAGSAFPVEAMKALGQIGYRPAIAVISKQLKGSAGADIRRAALQAIGNIGGSEALDAILDIVKAGARDSLSPELLEAATSALAGIAQKGNTDYRIQNALKDLAGNASPAVRRAAAAGLGAFPNNAASVDALSGLLASAKEPAVRVAAIQALGRQAGDAVMAALLRTLREKDLDPLVQAAALAAAGSNPGGVQAVQNMVDALGSADQGVRDAATAALSRLYPANQAIVSGTLARSLQTSSDEGFLITGTSLLASLADPSSVPVLLSLLSSASPEVQRLAIWALYKIRSASNPKVPETLESMVTNENEPISVRVAAVRALGAIGYDSPQLSIWQTLVTTVQMRGDKYSMLRYEAILALGQILPMKPQASAALLRVATKDADQELRKAAVEALRSAPALDDASAEALASSAAEAADAELKVRIVEALADSGSARALSPAQDLLSAAPAPAAALRRRVIAALAQVPGEGSAAAILDAAKDKDSGDFIEAVLEGFPRSLISSVVSRRLRSEADPNILSVLNSLESALSD